MIGNQGLSKTRSCPATTDETLKSRFIQAQRYRLIATLIVDTTANSKCASNAPHILVGESAESRTTRIMKNSTQQFFGGACSEDAPSSLSVSCASSVISCWLDGASACGANQLASPPLARLTIHSFQTQLCSGKDHIGRRMAQRPTNAATAKTSTE